MTYKNIMHAAKKNAPSDELTKLSAQVAELTELVKKKDETLTIARDIIRNYAPWHTYEKSLPMFEEALALTIKNIPQSQPRLKVVIRSFPESNGKRNWTALLLRVDGFDKLIGNCGGISIARGEYWNRVAYEAERVKLLLGQRDTEPFILDYGDDIYTPDEWKGESEALKAND